MTHTRRTLIVAIALAPIALVSASRRTSQPIQAMDASAFFLPHVADMLHRGTELSLVRRGNHTYVEYDGLIVARLLATDAPDGRHLYAQVASVERDESDRLHLFLTLHSQGPPLGLF